MGSKHHYCFMQCLVWKFATSMKRSTGRRRFQIYRRHDPRRHYRAARRIWRSEAANYPGASDFEFDRHNNSCYVLLGTKQKHSTWQSKANHRRVCSTTSNFNLQSTSSHSFNFLASSSKSCGHSWTVGLQIGGAFSLLSNLYMP